MNTLYKISLIVFFIISVITIKAQNPVVTLQHNGETQVFYGTNSFAEGIAAATKGDTLLLSVGAFTPPASNAINKGITIIGAGYLPDDTITKRRTTLFGDLIISSTVDSLHLEGIYFQKDLTCNIPTAIMSIEFVRCRLINLSFQTNTQPSITENCMIKECIITGSIYFQSHGNNFQIRNNIINGDLNHISSNAIISNNILLSTGNLFYNVSGSICQNNVITNSTQNYHFYQGGYNSIYNNLFVGDIRSYSTDNNYASNNYYNIPQADIFVNQSGNTFNYTHDYHLKNPEEYIGNDGTQVGIYGGLYPFKDGAAPSNPQVISKNISRETDANGNLKVDITVKAQEN